MIRMSLHMELQRAAVLLARRRVTPPLGDVSIEFIVGGPDTTIGVSKSAATPQLNEQAASLEVYKNMRGQTHPRLNPALARIKELGTIADSKLQPGDISGVTDSQMVGDDAITIEDGKVKIVALKLLALLRNWRPMRFRQEVTGHVRCAEGRLRVVAALGPEQSLLWPHRTLHLLQHLLPGRRLPLLTTQVFECASDIPASSDMSAAASAIGVELAHKLLAAALRDNWQAIRHYVAAVADYEAGAGEKDSTKLRGAIESAKKVHRFNPDFCLLPDLMIAISDRLSSIQDLDAAERALSVVPRLRSHVEPDEATRRALQVLTRLGSIYYRQGRFEDAVSVLRQARAMSTDEAYKRRRVLPVLAAALAGPSDGAGDGGGGKRDKHRDEAAGIIKDLVCRQSPSGIREVVRAIRNVLRGSGIVFSGRLSSEKSANLEWRLADNMAQILMFKEALDKYRKASKTFHNSKYLQWRCGVMCIYLNRNDNKQGNDAEEHFRNAEKHFRTAFCMNSKKFGKAPLLPGSRPGIDIRSQPKTDAWWAIQALQDWSYHLTHSDEQTKCEATRSTRQRKAYRPLKLALKYAPNEWDIHYNLAWAKQRILDDQGNDPGDEGDNYAEVKRSYDRAMVLAPTEALPLLGIAMLLEREGVHDAALKHFRAARVSVVAGHGFDVKPTATLCVQGEVRVLERLGRFEQAIKALNAEAAVDPDNPVVEQYLGFLKIKLNILSGSPHTDEPLEHVWRSRGLVSGAQTRFDLKPILKQADEIEANIRRWIGQPDQARPFLERGQEGSEYACASLSLMAHEAGDHAKARELRDQAEKLRPPRNPPDRKPPRNERYYRACIAAMIGNTEDAIRLLGEALEWQPGTRNWARVDPDLARIWEDRQFQALVGSRKGAALDR